MRRIDNIRSNQNIRQNKKEMKDVKRARSKKRRSPGFTAFVTTMKVLVIMFFVIAVILSVWAYNQIDFSLPIFLILLIILVISFGKNINPFLIILFVLFI